MADELKQALEEFVRFGRSLKGDERGEAQTFLDHLFRALGHAGVIEVASLSSERNAVNKSSALTMNRFPSRCASTQ
jgi:hypothetical protein